MNTNELVNTSNYPEYSAHQTGWGAALLKNTSKKKLHTLGKYEFLMEVDLADLNDPEIFEQ